MNNSLLLEMSKQDSRSHFLEIRKSISDESRYLLDSALFSNAAITSQFQKAKTILCYYPIRKEPNVIPLVRHAQDLGKTIAFPISHVEERRLSFHAVSDVSELVVGAYGIPEPLKDLPEITDFSNSLCLVPALAFDKNGRRLGYGGGYYDRFLSSFDGISMGLAYSLFYVESLPTEAHDATVDIIITENGGYFPYEKQA